MPRDKSADWNAIRAEYIAGGISTRKLAEKYSVSYNTLKYRAKVEHWSDGAKKVYRKVTAELPQRIAVNEVNRAAEIAEKKEQFAADLMEAAKESLQAYREKGALTAQNLKFFSGFLKDMTAKDELKTEAQSNGTLAAALTAATPEVWDDEEQDIPV